MTRTFVFAAPDRNIEILVTDYEDGSDPEVAVRPIQSEGVLPPRWSVPLERTQ